jgi:mRNA interferase YafQ
MLAIRHTRRFKRDCRREASGKHGKKLQALLGEIVTLLANQQPLPPRCVDHALVGEWKDFRDCHIRPDLILIYRQTGTHLELTRMGSHSELGL